MKLDTKDWCDVCDGRGETITEVVTKRVKGTPGDPKFLRLFQTGITEASKLEGLYKEREAPPPPPGPTININMPDGKIDFGSVSPDLVLDAKELLERIKVMSLPVEQRRIILEERKGIKQ
jgi:hypothetical protein